MDPENATPEADPQGTPPAAEPREGGTGSDQPQGIGMVTVPHPDLDQPGGGEPTEPQTPEGPERDGAPPAEPVTVLRYRGQEYPIESAEQLEQLASMGLDYAAKTQLAAPYVQFAKSMSELERTNPQAAEQVKALLQGKEPPTAQPAAGQAEPLYMQNPDGSLAPVPQEFVQLLDQYLERKGLTGKNPAAADNPELDELRQAVAPMVLNQRLEACQDYVKKTYGRDDFQKAVPLIQQELAAMGVAAGDPRDNPQTWLGIYAQLALAGRLDGIDPQTKIKDRPENKSGLKRGALPPGSTQTPKAPEGWRAATEKALKTGSAKDLEAAIGLRISHPDLEG